jgi:hypothetical protein
MTAMQLYHFWRNYSPVGRQNGQSRRCYFRRQSRISAGDGISLAADLLQKQQKQRGGPGGGSRNPADLA